MIGIVIGAKFWRPCQLIRHLSDMDPKDTNARQLALVIHLYGFAYKRRLNSHLEQSPSNIRLDNFMLYYYRYLELVFAVVLRQESAG